MMLTPYQRGFFVGLRMFVVNLPKEFTDMSLGKENFLRTKFVPLLQRMDPATPALWGKMNFQQMVEHFADVMMAASGKIKLQTVTPVEKLPAFKEFLLSEKPFKQNTKSPVLPPNPPALRRNTTQASIGKLQEELINFFEVFDKTPDLKTVNPIFGELDFAENIQLLYKHALHHLNQFGIEIN